MPNLLPLLVRVSCSHPISCRRIYDSYLILDSDKTSHQSAGCKRVCVSRVPGASLGSPKPKHRVSKSKLLLLGLLCPSKDAPRTHAWY